MTKPYITLFEYNWENEWPSLLFGVKKHHLSFHFRIFQAYWFIAIPPSSPWFIFQAPQRALSNQMAKIQVTRVSKLTEHHLQSVGGARTESKSNWGAAFPTCSAQSSRTPWSISILLHARRPRATSDNSSDTQVTSGGGPAGTWSWGSSVRHRETEEACPVAKSSQTAWQTVKRCSHLALKAAQLELHRTPQDPGGQPPEEERLLLLWVRKWLCSLTQLILNGINTAISEFCAKTRPN